MDELLNHAFAMMYEVMGVPDFMFDKRDNQETTVIDVEYEDLSDSTETIEYQEPKLIS